MNTITIAGRYENLVKLEEFVRQVTQEAGLDSFAIYSVVTAVEEASTNIIEHAYGGEGKGDIQCTCSVDPIGVTIQLHDQGKPFHPEKMKNPDTRAPLGKRNSHGLGLFIMRRWMDEVRFEFSPKSGNTLTMVKYREHPSE